MKHLALLALSCLPLAACTTAVDDPWLTDRGATSSVGSLAANRELSGELASAHLAAMDEAPIAVRRLSSAGARIEQIVYRNDTAIAGENMLTIERFDGRIPASAKAPTRDSLAREMRKAMPGVAMGTTPTLGTNAYGRFGSAVAALSTGGACVYAWQMIETMPGAVTQSFGPARIRLRYCHSGRSPQDLEALLSSLAAGPGAGKARPALAAQLRLPESGSRHGYATSAPAKANPVAAVETVRTDIPSPVVAQETAAISSGSQATVPIPLPK